MDWNCRSRWLDIRLQKDDQIEVLQSKGNRDVSFSSQDKSWKKWRLNLQWCYAEINFKWYSSVSKVAGFQDFTQKFAMNPDLW